MTPENTLARARSACGKHITYRLGCGGENPLVALPCDVENRCDCSGFALWALGVSRTVRLGHPWRDLFPPIAGQPYGIDTSRIVHAAHFGKAFRVVPVPAPGDLLVYPDVHAVRQGHVGIIGRVEEGTPVTVIHCSAGNMRALGDAIAETAVEPFWRTRGAIYVRPLGYEGGR